MTRRPPPSLHEDRLRALSREQLFAIASRGYGLMPAYEEMLGSDDRWAIVSYVKVLQMSQRAEVAALPADVRSELAKEAP
jgi:mono/diheme cytochrome c family protein